MDKKHEHLNDCLEHLLQDEETEKDLRVYPEEEKEECRRLLNAAAGLKQYADSIKPRSAFIAQTQAKLADTFEQKYGSDKSGLTGILLPFRRRAVIRAVIAAGLVFILTAVFAFSAVASEDAKPGYGLYPLKLAMEKIQLATTLSGSEKISCLIRLAETRAEEVAYAAETGNSELVESTLKKLEAHLAEVENTYYKIPGSRPQTTSDYEPPALKKIKDNLRGSSARANHRINQIKGPDKETRDKIIKRVEKAYSKVFKDFNKPVE
jgi:hypothetical protein